MKFELKGRLKDLIVDDVGIHIHYSKLLMKGDKTIPFSQVVSVQVKKPGLTNGYIYFQTVGSSGTRSTPNDIMTDDNSVVFTGKDKYTAAMEIKAHIEGKQQSVLKRSDIAVSGADEIIKFKSLLDAGVITKEEFEAKKKQLLGL